MRPAGNKASGGWLGPRERGRGRGGQWERRKGYFLAPADVSARATGGSINLLVLRGDAAVSGPRARVPGMLPGRGGMGMVWARGTADWHHGKWCGGPRAVHEEWWTGHGGPCSRAHEVRLCRALHSKKKRFFHAAPRVRNYFPLLFLLFFSLFYFLKKPRFACAGLISTKTLSISFIYKEKTRRSVDKWIA